MSNEELPAEGHADDIFNTFSYDAPRPEERKFLPWHHPRKQLVRKQQWLAQIEELLDVAHPDGNVLRYLGLPGDDLLDLRMFHNEICAPRNLMLKFLGFNRSASSGSAAQAELNISMDEVTKLAYVDTSSEIMGDDFSRLANSNSMAWRKAHTLGPYDIVNLDLCDGLGRHVPGVLADTHYNALTQLLSLQARHKNPWLLLLTTRAGAGHVDAAVVESLIATYQQNLLTCAPFRERSSEDFSISDEASLRSAAGTADGLLAVFLVGLCKWLMRMSLAQRPPTKVSVRHVMAYRVVPESPCEDLVSIALRFEPTFTPGVDPTGLAGFDGSVPSECELAVRALRPISRRRNADDVLAADSQLYERMVEDMSRLLELARYDVAAYRGWLQERFAAPLSRRAGGET